MFLLIKYRRQERNREKKDKRITILIEHIFNISQRFKLITNFLKKGNSQNSAEKLKTTKKIWRIK